MRRWDLGLLAVLLAGCGTGPYASVQGQVTLNGEPVHGGSITFEPTDGSEGPIAGASILKGRYRIAADRGVLPGTNRVEIRWSRKTGRTLPPNPGGSQPVVEVAEAVPASYNDNSTLRAEVKLGANQLDYELHAP
jgi:hypothetical protein